MARLVPAAVTVRKSVRNSLIFRTFFLFTMNTGSATAAGSPKWSSVNCRTTSVPAGVSVAENVLKSVPSTLIYLEFSNSLQKNLSEKPQCLRASDFTALSRCRRPALPCLAAVLVVLIVLLRRLCTLQPATTAPMQNQTAIRKSQI